MTDTEAAAAANKIGGRGMKERERERERLKRAWRTFFPDWKTKLADPRRDAARARSIAEHLFAGYDSTEMIGYLSYENSK